METVLNHLEWLILALSGLLIWVGRMAWSASQMVARHEARIEALENAIRQMGASCQRHQEAIKASMRQEIRLAIQEFQHTQAEKLSEIRQMLASHGTKIDSVERQTSACFKRLNRRTGDREEE